ncbi:MAG: cob(I)yrinic acid a,c-diamide adenosyltransferase [Actinomycetota bacterium]|nr:cob(I)yrinic acid a,c-diamide adenosyltransferase [Actinomycetota bacterium]
MSGRIYTRGGDSGETSLVGGSRVAKSSIRVEAYGSVDEANATIGLARAAIDPTTAEETDLDRMLDFAQHRLFNCSSSLATPTEARTVSTPSISAEDVMKLESEIDRLTAATSALGGFVLPGGCEQSARLHVARTVVRKAERRVIKLASVEPVDEHVIAFINRLSDLLFAAARYANGVHCGGDVYWNPGT